jgi:hypothetical protein
MKIQISENQLRRIISEQTSLSTGVQSGTYLPTVKYKGQNGQTIIPQEKWPIEKPQNLVVKGPTECTKSFNQNTLDKAINWWRDWLNNPITLDKFKKNWGYGDYYALKIFKKYFNLLDRNYIKVEFLNDESNRMGGYSGISLANKYIVPIFVDKFNRTITINTFYCKNNTPESAVSIFIHELQHYLYAVHPFHPDEKVFKDFGFIDDIPTVKRDKEKFYKNTTPIIKDIINGSDRLLNQKFDEFAQSGIKHFESSNYRNYYKAIVKNLINNNNNNNIESLNYLGQTDEIMSRLSQVRQLLNLSPGQDITPQDIDYIFQNNHVAGFTTFTENIILCDKSLKDILTLINSYAKQDLNKSKVLPPKKLSDTSTTG